jgi:iron-sulfur cluster protein
MDVMETDLGEYIVQLRGEHPTHMLIPAIHLSRDQVADLFTEVSGEKQTNDIEKLVKVARNKLRIKFAEADMGISGANVAVAENGSFAICTNEGNARMVTTKPPVHVAIFGLEKIMRNIKDAMYVLQMVPRNAIGQLVSAYVSWIAGANESTLTADKKKQLHIVVLDNGRTELNKDPLCGQVLRCVRCGACANVCPVYRLVGGAKMGHIYMGALGLILTYFYHGKDKAKNLLQNCINCEACKDICSASINLPGIIQELRARVNEEDGSPTSSSLLAKVLTNRKLFHTLLKFGKFAQRPLTGGSGYIRHLPEIFAGGQGFRALPAIAAQSFRDRWPELAPSVSKGTVKVGLFAGCAQDFVYPEHLEAAVKLMAAKNCKVDFPMEQSCCGLPLYSMGEREAARSVAKANIKGFEDAGVDYIVTLCASCASHMKNNYARILEKESALPVSVSSYTSKIMDFSSFMKDILGYSESDFDNKGEQVCYHASCHLCRGMGVTEQPRALIKAAGEYKPSAEEETCCGFGGSYSTKFPEISSQILDSKLNKLEASGAGTLVMDCPGCVMQLKGGEEKRGNKLKVEHISEFLARTLK